MLEQEITPVQEIELPDSIESFGVLCEQNLQWLAQEPAIWQRVLDNKPQPFDWDNYHAMSIFSTFFMSVFSLFVLIMIGGNLPAISIFFTVVFGGFGLGLVPVLWFGARKNSTHKKLIKNYQHMIANESASTEPAIIDYHNLKKQIIQSNDTIERIIEDRSFRFEIIHWLDYVQEHATNIYGTDFFSPVISPKELRAGLVFLFSEKNMTDESLEHMKQIMVEVLNMKRDLKICFEHYQQKNQKINDIEAFEKSLMNYQSLQPHKTAPPISHIKEQAC